MHYPDRRVKSFIGTAAKNAAYLTDKGPIHTVDQKKEPVIQTGTAAI
jgi:hypothetical protein